MTGTPSYQRLFAELKRRRVFRVAAVYGAVAFVVLQVADIMVPVLALPESVTRAIALLLILCFPIALVMAWAFEVTPKGMKRTEDPSEGEIEAIVAEPRSRRWPSGVLARLRDEAGDTEEAAAYYARVIQFLERCGS